MQRKNISASLFAKLCVKCTCLKTVLCDEHLCDYGIGSWKVLVKNGGISGCNKWRSLSQDYHYKILVFLN